MNKILALGSLGILLSLTACAPQFTPMINTTDVSQVDFSNVDELKVGTDCAHYLLGIVGPFGRAELVEAVKDAEITKVKTVDYSSHNYLVYSRMCVKAYGE